MPKLWEETIQAHRQAVREAILDTTWALVSEQGLSSVTMSQIAEGAGVGRATLYKYFPDVDTILVAWHERQIAEHLAELSQLASSPGDAGKRLRAVLEAYALICNNRGGHGADLAALLHHGAKIHRAQQQLIHLIRDLLAEAAEQGRIRNDATPGELAAYCVHALAAAGSLSSRAAVHRLVTVTLHGLRPPQKGPPAHP